MTRYSSYKPSGVEWIGEIPQHWTTIKIKRLTPVKRGASPRPIDNPKYFDDNGTYHWVRIADVTASERYLTQTEQRLSELGSSLSVKREPGDFFLSIAGTVGKPIITRVKCCIHDGFVWFPSLPINPEFLYFLFTTGQPYRGLGKWGTQLNLNTDTVGDIDIPLPSAEEIETIVSYLDKKTALIDEAIQKKQHLVELLQEERIALINHVVTRGLNPDVKLKPSGIEWLGDIPEHWEVKRLKYLISRIHQGWSPQCENRPAEQGEWGVLKAGCVNYGRFNDLENKALPAGIEPDESLEVKQGDLLMSRANTRELVGSATLIATTREKLLLCDKLYRICYSDKVEAKYLELQLSSKVTRIQIESHTTGASSSMQNISQEIVRELFLFYPPKSEQGEIVRFVDEHSGKIRSTIERIGREIQLLTEYRHALINEVVTGKVCVLDDALQGSPETVSFTATSVAEKAELV